MDDDKIAVSIEAGNDLDAPLSPSFGRAPRFLLSGPGPGDDFEIVENTAAASGHGAGTGAAALLADRGVTAVISGRFGPNAYKALEGAGIGMYTALVEKTAREAIERFRAGRLKKFRVEKY